MNLMQLPDESNSKRQVSNEKHIAYRIGSQISWTTSQSFHYSLPQLFSHSQQSFFLIIYFLFFCTSFSFETINRICENITKGVKDEIQNNNEAVAMIERLLEKEERAEKKEESVRLGHKSHKKEISSPNSCIIFPRTFLC